MSLCLRTALIGSLSAHLGLSKSRLETLSALLIGLIHGRTVNLSHVASHCHGAACHASKYRRLQRFFQYVRLDQAVIAAIVVRMLKLSRPKCLALDRTNWKLGRKDVNILMLAIVTRRFRVPLLWSVLCHPGNSNTDQRIALLQRYLALFEPGSIDLLLADRVHRRRLDGLPDREPSALRHKGPTGLGDGARRRERMVDRYPVAHQARPSRNPHARPVPARKPLAGAAGRQASRRRRMVDRLDQ